MKITPTLLVKVLTRARDLLSKPNGWIKGSDAETRQHMTVPATDPRACRFCSYGAAEAAAKELAPNSNDYVFVRDAALNVLRGGSGAGLSVTVWNDEKDRTLEEVIMGFEFGILCAKSRGAA